MCLRWVVLKPSCNLLCSIVSHFVRDVPRRALLENSLEVFFIWTGFKAVRKETTSFPRNAQCNRSTTFAFWKNLARRYVPYLPEALFGYGVRHQPTSNSLCSRDVRRFLVRGHLASDLGCEVRNRIEVTLEKLRSADAIVQNRTIYKDLRIQLRALQSRDWFRDVAIICSCGSSFMQYFS